MCAVAYALANWLFRLKAQERTKRSLWFDGRIALGDATIKRISSTLQSAGSGYP
jgi:hypothetical protein